MVTTFNDGYYWKEFDITYLYPDDVMKKPKNWGDNKYHGDMKIGQVIETLNKRYGGNWKHTYNI